jgi:hypothetical protein
MAGNEFDNLKQTIWNNRLQVALKKLLVYGNLANTKYEGEARRGGTVKISQLGEVDTGDYTAYSDMTFQTLDDAQLSLVIDQQKYFAFQLDVTDTVFIPMDLMAAGIDRGTYKIRDTIDQFISGKYTDAGISYGSSASPKATSSGSVIQHLAEFFETITEGNIPLDGRWATLPPWVFTKLTLAGVDKESPNRDVFQEGYVQNVVGFSRLYQTNNTTQIRTSVTTIMSSAGNEAIAYAGAIDGNIRILPAEKRRATNVDGLWVYGAKVTRPDMLAVMYSTETAN